MRKPLFLFVIILLTTLSAIAQTRRITGKVVDEAGQPVSGATVLIRGSSTGTSANENGDFNINAKTGDVLVVSSVGIPSTEITVGSGSSVSVSLSRQGQNLQEVVVSTAQGIRREKRSLGYAAPTVSNADLTRGQSTSAINALSGKVPGVNITSTAGAPGSSSRIVIRGGSSITGNNQPLMVVDGIPIDNSNIAGGAGTRVGAIPTYLASTDFGNRGNDIDPNDIESITVLKGPGATALYGSRASNGALIITTKSGKGNQNKKNEVTFSTGITLSNILKLPDFQNQYGQGYTGGNGQPFSDPIENWSWGPKFTGVVQPWGQEINGVRQERPYSAVENNVRDFFETGKAFTNSVSFAGGTEKSTFFLSLNSLNSNGIMPTNRDNYNRYSVRFNGSTQLSNKFRSSLSVNYSRITTDQVSGGQGAGSVFDNVLQTPRNIPLPELRDLSNPYNAIGGIFDANVNELFGYYGAYTVNPYFLLANYHNKNDVDRVIGNFSITYKPTDWLDITERLGGDIYADRRRELEPKFSLIPADNTSGNYAGQTKSSSGRYYEANYNVNDITHDLMVTARKDITKDLNASLLLGHNVRMRTLNQFDAETNTAGGLVIPGYYNLANSNGAVATANDYSVRRLVGLYADFNLGYKNFLFLGATARNDWSSTLPKQNNSFFYPGVSGSFVFTELLRTTGVTKWLNYGKLRSSWAQVGNDAAPYQLESYYGKTTVNGGFGTTVFPLGAVPGYTLGDRIGSADLKPEITTAYEVGTELAFLKSRISVDFSYYKNNSKNQILAVPIPSSTGFTSRISNIGLVKNQGIELGIRATPVKTASGFTWEVYGTYTRNRNEVSQLDVEQIVIGGFSGMSVVAANGRPYGNFYGRDLLRDDLGRVIVNAATGIPRLTTTAVYLGTYNPDFQASLGTNLAFKGFSLGVLFDTRQGGKFYSRTKDILDFVGTAAETADGDREGYIFPNSVYTDASGKMVENTTVKFHPEDYFPSAIPDGQHILDASYIKLRELNLTYGLPRDLLARTPFGSASISLFGNNLWIKTAKENRYVDPEINSAGATNTQGFDFTAQPSVRNYGVNLKVTF
ncbi:SusC/RagA family TonB-linked outer membrane protein [Segetibacter sp.]|jgi:TonB-linked SusC/RagA family outer membrane protein|uniref:SusC/RagA family TonB-linked outer membrane protein n=1 Tax=Segetibacter sp. TaxID=2231182 RepID=UPI002629C84D|nr:SusC/RagA family TonB-linked outer membrane protein [Segetibacter sp.]MCW3082253.1 TonB-dependent receptor plug [Segetibacter sp.]